MMAMSLRQLHHGHRPLPGDDAMHVVFGAYELEVDQRELRRAGEVVPLEPKAFKALVYFQGEFSRARILLEQGLALYEAEQLCYQILTNGVEAGMFLLATLGWVLWPLGHPDKALESVRQAVSIAQGLSHPQSMDQALMAASWVHQHRREESAVLTQAAMAVAIAREQGFQMQFPSRYCLWSG